MGKFDMTTTYGSEALGSHHRDYYARLSCARLTILPPVIFILACLLSACGGGGSGGAVASSDPPLFIEQPVFVRSSEREPLQYGAAYQSEFTRQPGLAQIAADKAYARGFAGFNVRAGVVDTGVDGEHSELGAITAGLDFHGNSFGLSDPDGHGTHVASLMAAARNQKQMHGVAPHASVKAYRIFNHDGSFGAKTGGQILPTLVTHAIDQNIDLLNNSWSSNYEITDLSKSAIAGALGSELGAWQKAVSSGMVLVWAAGNDGDDEVSIRAGLPYHYSGLAKGWLAVVAFDETGKEPRYSNRCGLAQQWCVAAPGGGDYVYRDGIYGARSGGGYERRSGTSMAAPHVSGALALVLDAFPQLTAQQGATRLRETAHYEGLETADGCTIDVCQKADMAAVFGQGRIDVERALAPIGTLSLTTKDAPISVERTAIDTGLIIDEAFLSAMTGVRFIATDSFDQASFAIPATAFIQPAAKQAGFSDHLTDPTKLSQSVAHGGQTHYVANHGQFPAPRLGPGRLYDISALPMTSWAGFVGGGLEKRGAIQAHFGYERDRQLVMVRTQIGEQNAYNLSQHWLLVGASHAKNRWLDSRGSGALEWGRGHSQWVTLGTHQLVAGGAVTAEYQRGQSAVNQEGSCLICKARADFESWRLAFNRSYKGHEVTLALLQPLTLKQVRFDLSSASHNHIAVSAQRPQRIWTTKVAGPLSLGRWSLAHYVKDDRQQVAGNDRPFGMAHQITFGWQLAF